MLKIPDLLSCIGILHEYECGRSPKETCVFMIEWINKSPQKCLALSFASVSYLRLDFTSGNTALSMGVVT